MRNLEYKARIDDPKPYQAKARELGADLWGDLRQTDTYYAVPNGRLKLRETAGLQGELIFYQRDEEGADRASDYEVARTTEPAVFARPPGCSARRPCGREEAADLARSGRHAHPSR